MTSGLLVSGSGIQFCFGQTLINFAILERTQLSSLQLHSPHVGFVGPVSGRGTSKNPLIFRFTRENSTGIRRRSRRCRTCSWLFRMTICASRSLRSLSLTHTHSLSLSLALSLSHTLAHSHSLSLFFSLSLSLSLSLSNLLRS